MDRFEGRTAVVTGAAGGIGRGLVEAAAARGMNVVAADLDQKGLDRLAADLALGARLVTAVTDVSKSEAVAALADLAYDRFGATHLLFNNAGVMATGRAWELEPAAWRRLLEVNLMGVVHGVHAFVPRMLAADEAGVIVNTASMAGLFATAELSAYAAAKHAVIGLSESLLYELQASGAKLGVAVICPGAVRTDLMRSDRAATAMSESLQAAMDARGMDPDRLADIVFDHLARGRFWIFPHPHMLKRVEQRCAEMLRDAAAGPPLSVPS